jgi:hypothetical protein
MVPAFISTRVFLIEQFDHPRIRSLIDSITSLRNGTFWRTTLHQRQNPEMNVKNPEMEFAKAAQAARRRPAALHSS